MTLELTKEEYSRLKDIQTRGHSHSQIQPEREIKIIQAIREQKSYKWIKKEYRTSDYTIFRLKKQYGL